MLNFLIMLKSCQTMSFGEKIYLTVFREKKSHDLCHFLLHSIENNVLNMGKRKKKMWQNVNNYLI